MLDEKKLRMLLYNAIDLLEDDFIDPSLLDTPELLEELGMTQEEYDEIMGE